MIVKYPSGVRKPKGVRVQPVKNKYRNIKTTIDGITFDSKAEANYYYQLKQRGVTNFKMQEAFIIHDPFTLHGKKYAAIKYKPDFTFYDGDKLVKVVDVKGKRTADFHLKAKLFAKRYGLAITLAKYNYRNKTFEEITA